MIKVSQSLIKNWQDYQQGKRCGIQIKHQYLKGEEVSESSYKMELGHYFEFIATGALPKHGREPSPPTTKAGNKTIDHERALIAAKLYKNVLEWHDIEVLEVGKKVENEVSEGTVDILATVNGAKSIVDLKYSSYLNSTYRAWSWQPEAVAQNETYLIQAIHYSWILGGLPFYFLVIDSNTGNDYRFMKVEFRDEHYASHEILVHRLYKEINDNINNARAYPSRARCQNCLISGRCPFFLDKNQTEIIYPQI